MTDAKPLDHREDLTRQERNLLLVSPIARLALERNVLFKEEVGLADGLDLQYLALTAIDFVMERTAIEAGAAPTDTVGHVAGEAERMKATLSPEQSRKVGQVALNYLANARDRHRAFRIEYYDGVRGAFHLHDFRLLALHTGDDGSVRYKLGSGARTLTLAMLEISPEFAHEAEAIMIRKAVDRGRFADAHAIAQRSRVIAPVGRGEPLARAGGVEARVVPGDRQALEGDRLRVRRRPLDGLAPMDLRADYDRRPAQCRERRNNVATTNRATLTSGSGIFRRQDWRAVRGRRVRASRSSRMAALRRSVAFIITLAALAFAPAFAGAEVVGRASVINGDTIEIHGQRIRLHGTDAPESGKHPVRAAGWYVC